MAPGHDLSRIIKICIFLCRVLKLVQLTVDLEAVSTTKSATFLRYRDQRGGHGLPHDPLESLESLNAKMM